MCSKCIYENLEQIFIIHCLLIKNYLLLKIYLLTKNVDKVKCDRIFEFYEICFIKKS